MSLQMDRTIIEQAQEQPIDIEKSNKNFKDRKLKYFNYNKYGHMAKECQLKKKERETRKCFKCDNEGHIAKDCKGKKSMKKCKVQEKSDNKNDKEKEQDFDNDLKQAQYKRSSCKFPK